MEHLNELLHGNAKQCAEVLQSSPALSNEELQAALTNALMKISDLEATIKGMAPAINAASHLVPIGSRFPNDDYLG